MASDTVSSDHAAKADASVPQDVSVTSEKAATTAPGAGSDKAHDEVEDFPDPDEDDLDDLDDMLDDFSTVKIDGDKKPETQSTAPGTVPSAAPKPAATTAPDQSDEPFSEEEFTKQLQAGMADLLGELQNSPEMQAQFEDIFKQFGGGGAPADSQPSSATPGGASGTGTGTGTGESTASPGGADASFQDTIRRTMERMQSSGDQATAAAAAGGADDFMSELLKQMSSGDFNGEGSEEDFSKMLMGMMEQLTNKEILYEPMKELHDKFPEWLKEHAAKTSAEDLKRYEAQQKFVGEIVAKFEEASYSDSNAADREYIVDKMQKMQAEGSPPPDLVGDMASAQDLFSAPDEQCNPQ